MKLLLHFLATLLCYAVLDLLWLGVLAKSFVQRQVGFLMAERPNWGAAAAFYTVFTGCLLYLCVYPALAAGSASKAAINGAVFGLATYGTYELVNKALLKEQFSQD
jgi:uncharacterized membrane protein